MALSKAYLLGTLILGIFALVMFIFGLVAPYWTWTRGSAVVTHSGLWEWCTALVDECGNIFGSAEFWPKWLQVTQALVLLSMLFSLIALVLATVWALTAPTKAMCAAAGVLFAAAGIFGICGSIVYASKIPGHLSWAFYFTIVASLIFIIPAVICGLAARNTRSKPKIAPQ